MDLNTHFDPIIAQLFTEFKKAIPELTVDNTKRNKIENAQLQKEKSELEETRIELKKSIAYVERMKNTRYTKEEIDKLFLQRN